MEKFIDDCLSGKIEKTYINSIYYIILGNYYYLDKTSDGDLLFYVNLKLDYSYLIKPEFQIIEDVIHVKLLKKNIKYFTSTVNYEYAYKIPSNIQFYEFHDVFFNSSLDLRILEFIDKYY
jgi:hypothetical protein